MGCEGVELVWVVRCGVGVGCEGVELVWVVRCGVGVGCEVWSWCGL